MFSNLFSLLHVVTGKEELGMTHNNYKVTYMQTLSEEAKHCNNTTVEGYVMSDVMSLIVKLYSFRRIRQNH